MSEKLTTKYNYVFYNIATDYLEPVFGSLNKYSNIKVFKQAFDANTIISKLFFYHWSAKLNNKFKLPFKSLWYKPMFNVEFNNDKPTCYVFLGSKYISQDCNISKYIKRINPNNKVVVLFCDLISKKNLDVESLKASADYIITYDGGEAEKYGIVYGKNSLGYEAIVDVTEPSEFENDVYFVGFAKDRLKDIHSVFNFLSDNGLKCKFIICGTKESERIKKTGLIYSDPISYLENLKNILDSRCVLEIVQCQSTGVTLRVKESQIYKRKLLTNNNNLINQLCFDENNMSVFKNCDDIDLDFLKTPIDYNSFDTEYYDPSKLIKYFETLMGGEKG